MKDEQQGQRGRILKTDPELSQRERMGTFWGVFMILNLVVVAMPLGVFIWAGFDIHNRLPYVLMAQVPALIMLLIRRVFRRQSR